MPELETGNSGTNIHEKIVNLTPRQRVLTFDKFVFSESDTKGGIRVKDF